ncbi:carbohydrate ABC transporter permease [Amycolatopsis jejuensis]|uniref:carbohydrate ABC transporter permease n=1 Tax=Amycolatopsis jejuensis TaxID=330084 RepID=UPI0005257FFE|nr:carbohydrate ABC transporter permease [Amycolatopsis jejuensis]
MIRAAVRWTALTLSAILFLVPFYLLLRNGLASRAEITSPGWTWWPKQVHWENLAKLFQQPDVPFARSILNSVIVAVLQTVGLLVLCSLAGYGLARVPSRYAKPVFYAVLATLMIPTSVTFVPSFVVVSSLGWLSDFRGLVIPGLFSAFSVFLFRQYFLDFPRELEDAGRVDGLTRWGVFRRIVVPNSRGFFAAIAVITVIGSWNAFLWPLIIAQSPDSWTVQVALSGLLTAQNPQLNLLFLAAALSILPIVFLFAFLQRYLVRGVMEAGLKG